MTCEGHQTNEEIIFRLNESSHRGYRRSKDFVLERFSFKANRCLAVEAAARGIFFVVAYLAEDFVAVVLLSMVFEQKNFWKLVVGEELKCCVAKYVWLWSSLTQTLHSLLSWSGSANEADSKLNAKTEERLLLYRKLHSQHVSNPTNECLNDSQTSSTYEPKNTNMTPYQSKSCKESRPAADFHMTPPPLATTGNAHRTTDCCSSEQSPTRIICCCILIWKILLNNAYRRPSASPEALFLITFACLAGVRSVRLQACVCVQDNFLTSPPSFPRTHAPSECTFSNLGSKWPNKERSHSPAGIDYGEAKCSFKYFYLIPICHITRGLHPLSGRRGLCLRLS